MGEERVKEQKTALIRGGTVVTSQSVSQQDVLIQGEKIAEIGDLSDAKADTIINAEGLLVLPGAVDTHVHFNDYFMNTMSVHDFFTGTLAAAHGGVTSIVDFANQVPGKSLQDALQSKKELPRGRFPSPGLSNSFRPLRPDSSGWRHRRGVWIQVRMPISFSSILRPDGP